MDQTALPSDENLRPTAILRPDWSGLRVRRVVWLIALVGALPLGLAIAFRLGRVSAAPPGLTALYVAGLLLVGVTLWLRAWPCPRCGFPFAARPHRRWTAVWPARCVHCGLEDFAPEAAALSRTPRLAEVVAPEHAPLVAPDGRWGEPDAFVRLIAASEIAGGALLMGMVPWMLANRLPAPWWFLALVESLGAVGILAGVQLWRGDPRGLLASLALQAAQVVAVYSAKFTYAFQLGLGVTYFATTAPRFFSGATSLLTLGPHPELPAGIAVNFVAFLFLLRLAHARPGRVRAAPQAILEAPEREPPPNYVLQQTGAEVHQVVPQHQVSQVQDHGLEEIKPPAAEHGR